VLCEFTITVTDMQTPTAVCQDITVYLDNDGNVSIVADDVDGGSTDNCDDLSLSINVSEFDCDNIGDNLVTLTVEDGNENTSICVSTVTVVDSVAPTFTCPDNITVDGCDDLVPDVITGITDEADNCGVASVVQDPVAGLDFGQTNGNSVDITVTVTDVNGNVSSCVVLLIIEDDDEPDFLNCPTAMIMIGNDPDQCSGKVNWQPPVAVDDCLPLPISAPGIPLPGTVVQTTGPLPGTAVAITCPPTPSNITYIATDANGNTSSCTFQVMVVDTEEPEFDADIIMPNDTTVNCHQVPTNCVYHGPNVCTPLTNSDVNDNCTSPADLDITFEEISTQNPDPAVCGHYDYDLTRIWTVTDCAGNQLVHTQQIEVQDTTKPVAVCKNITVTLDDFGNATITPRDLDGGSTDNCAENQYLTFTASQTLFTCADLPNSPITVILTVTDPCGNFSTCTAIVTVLEGNGDCTPEYDIDGSDPCICLDNATTLDNGQFGEVIQIHGLAGQTWRVFSSTGLYLATSPAPPAAPIPVPSNALLTNGQVDGYDNDGDTVIDELDERVYYTYTGRHVDGQGYSAIIRSNLNDQVQLENKCYYPTPYFTDELYLDDPLCIGTPPFTIKVAEVNNAAGGVVPGSIMVNGVVTTVFDAGNLGLGAHTVMATFNAGAAQPFTKVNGVVVAGSEAAAIADPGCNQKITKVVNVVETPVTLICNDLVYVSIDADCVESIDADDVLEGTYFCLDDYRVEVDKTLPYGNGPWVPADFNASDIGKTYQYRVIRITGAANICWGEIKIEDKLAPALTCPVDVTIACSESTEMQHTGNILIADCSNTITVVDDEYTDFGQCSDPRGQLVRTWIVTDTWGNQAACEQIITITKFDLDDVVFPNDVTVDCEVTYLNPDGIASVNTGEPSINGASIIGSTWCGAQVGFNDTYFYGCGGTFTILREWGVLNNCEPLGPGNPVTYTQRILVNDLGGPTFNCPPAVTVSTNPFECCSNTALPSMLVSEGCSGILGLEAKVTGIDPNNGNIITFTVGGHLEDFPGNNYWNPDTLAVFNYTQCLPLGTYDVRYKASDECGNTSYCNFALTIADLIPPTVSCDQVTQVALSNDGVAIIPAANLNDGTADNCCLDFFEVRRMDGGSCTGTDFAPEVQFCCSDIGDTLMVVFRAWDCHGNYNDCMVSVLVEDKIKPACQPPANVSVNCENFDPSLWSYGIPDVLDNCCLDTNKVFLGQIGLTHSVNYTLFDTVCNKGTITRTFRAFDCSGNSSQCTQRVFVTYLQDYYVKFPNDAIVTTCDGTGNFGEPLFFGEDCELLGVSHTDDIFTVVPDACFKIERTWQIINWCTFNPNLPLIEVPNPSPNPITNASANLPGPTVSACGTIAPWAPTVVKINPTDPTATNYCTFWQADANGYKYKQIIKVQDGQAPTGTYIVPTCDNQNWFTPNNNQLWNEMYWWDNGIQTHDLCEEPTDLSIVGTDACSGANVNIEYLLFLDLDNDGTMETVVNSVNTGLAGLGWNNVLYNNLNTPNFGGGTPRAFDERPVPTNQKYGFSIQETVQGTNKTASVRWNTQQQQNTYVTPELPHGTHKIKWFVTDGCGNNSEYEYTFTVKDCKAPTVVCINGLSVNIMPTGMIQLWASDFLQYTEDNCTPAGQIRIGIRKCGTGTGFPVDAQGNPITNVTFDCTELGTQCVELWAMDAAGNADYCETYVIVQDNLGGCPNADKLNVVGELKTEMTEGVEEAMVHINGTSTFAPPYSYFDLSDTLGLYAVTNSVPLAATFTIAPEKDDNPLNGVTTYDLVLMSKHILGLEPLNSPYKMIAADANKSGSITTFDIVELRKLILGIYTELPNNTSWRFVDKAFVFPNANNPFQSQFPETISVADAMVSQIGEDFVGVKVGDVNSTAVANANMQAEDRTSGTAILDIEDRAVAAGEVFEVTFKAAEQLKGFQFTMLQDGLKTVGVKEEDGITAGNFGTIFEGATTVSVDGPQSFTLQMRAEKSGKLSEMLGVSGSITRAEAYGNAGRLNVAFRFDHKTVAGVGFELYQNQPNPFVNKTTIGFFLPEASEATLSIFDEAGRMVYQQKGQFPKGENTVVLDRALLNTVGVLYYQLETAKDMASRKMIQSK
ncbi:MAG: T9SS type A sorting domain-containing protein, partial [Saprospiraceae bacterium]|nr:T9SS type A sorting domain-containing protein [Saprospiraceae bacterium]